MPVSGRLRSGAAAAGLLVAMSGCTGIEPVARRSIPAEGKYIDGVEPGAWQPVPPAFGLAVDRARARVNSPGLVESPTLEAYCAEILGRLATQSPVVIAPPTVLLESEPSMIAETTPEGHILFDLGLLMRMKVEDELAFVLAHELSHLILNHHAQAGLQSTQETALQATRLGLALAQMIENSGRIDPASIERHDAVRYQKLALDINRSFLTPAWNRTQEMEADILGLDLMVRAGYDPEYALDFFDIILESDTAPMNPLATTVRAALAPPPVSGAPPSSAAYWENADDRIVAALELEGRAELRRKYPHVPERMEKVESYLLREYGDAAPAIDGIGGWEANVGAPEVQALLEGYRAAFEADALIEQGNLAEAEGLLEQAVAGEAGGQTYPRLVLARLRELQGRIDLARRNLEQAIEGEYSTYNAYQALVNLAFSEGRGAEAQGLSDRAQGEFSGVPELWPFRISIMMKAGNPIGANALYQYCKKVPSISARCEATVQEMIAEAKGMTGP